MKIVRESLNEIKRGNNTLSTVGVGKAEHQRGLYDMLKGLNFLSISNLNRNTNEWSDTNAKISKMLGCKIEDIRFDSFYYDNLWESMKEWLGEDYTDIVVHNDNRTTSLPGKVWKNDGFVAIKIPELMQGNMNFYQVLVTRHKLQELGIS